MPFPGYKGPATLLENVVLPGMGGLDTSEDDVHVMDLERESVGERLGVDLAIERLHTDPNKPGVRVTVKTVEEGSKLGLKPGDEIVALETTEVARMSEGELLQRLASKKVQIATRTPTKPIIDSIKGKMVRLSDLREAMKQYDALPDCEWPDEAD